MKTKNYSIPSIKSSDAKQVSFDATIFDKKIKNLKQRLNERDNEILRLTKELEHSKLQLDAVSGKLKERERELDLEGLKDAFYKDLITLNTHVDALKAIHGWSEGLSNSKSISEDIGLLEKVEVKDLLLMRETLQNILKQERKLADLLLEVKLRAPEGFQNISAADMAARWNQDMNTFVGVLFELTRRHQVDQLNEGNLLRIKQSQQEAQFRRFKDTQKQTSKELEHDQKLLHDLQAQVEAFKQGKAHIQEEVNKVLKEQQDQKLKRTKFEQDKLSGSEEKLIQKLKLALKEDNKTIVKLSNSVVALQNKQQDFQTEIKTLRDEIDSKNDQLSKLQTFFKEEKTVLNKNQEEERLRFKAEIDSLRKDSKAKEKKIEELFLESKSLSTKQQELEKTNASLSEVNSVLEEKSASAEKKQLSLLSEAQADRVSFMGAIQREQKARKELDIKLQSVQNENKLLAQINSKFQEERKKLQDGIISKNNEVSSLLTNQKQFADMNPSGLDDISLKLNKLENTDKSNNNDFRAGTLELNNTTTNSNNNNINNSNINLKSEKNDNRKLRFNQVQDETVGGEQLQSQEVGGEAYKNWKDVVEKDRFKQKEDVLMDVNSDE